MNNDLIKIDSEQIKNIANDLKNLNDKILETLKEAQAAINNLDKVWQGVAANTTKDSINSFASEYFESYHDLINEYITFLNATVAEGYEQTETVNTNLADSFK